MHARCASTDPCRCYALVLAAAARRAGDRGTRRHASECPSSTHTQPRAGWDGHVDVDARVRTDGHRDARATLIATGDLFATFASALPCADRYQHDQARATGGAPSRRAGEGKECLRKCGAAWCRAVRTGRSGHEHSSPGATAALAGLGSSGRCCLEIRGVCTSQPTEPARA